MLQNAARASSVEDCLGSAATHDIVTRMSGIGWWAVPPKDAEGHGTHSTTSGPSKGVSIRECA